MTPIASNTSEQNSASNLALAAVIIGLGLAFLMHGHDLKKSSVDEYTLTADEMQVSVETGDVRRRMGFTLVAGIGLVFLLRRGGRSLRLNDPLALLLGLYVAWCVLSIIWSTNPVFTAKRVGVLVLCFIGAVGVGRWFSTRQLCILATVVVAACCVLGVAAEVALGTFRPAAAGYRFSGTVHPNSQGMNCAALCLAAAVFFGRSRRQTILAIGLLTAAGILLVLTRSRTACAATAITLTVVIFMRIPPRIRLLTAVGGAWACAAAMLVCCFSGSPSQRQVANAMLMGRTEQVTSLNGRIPLWTELLAYVQERPLLGYGYDTFWSPEHIEDISRISQWATNVGHSLYLEAVLNVGLIGSLLLFAAMAIGTYRLGARYAKTGQEGYGFLFALLLFWIVSGVLEAGFLRSEFLPLIATCGLVHATFEKEEPAT